VLHVDVGELGEHRRHLDVRALQSTSDSRGARKPARHIGAGCRSDRGRFGTAHLSSRLRR
jgi:hypothetical protein